MKILFIGDVTGEAGRKAVSTLLPSIQKKYKVDVTIANGDNAAHGLGITPKVVRKLLNLGVDVITGGNHLFDRKDIIPELEDIPQLLRGANYPSQVPGEYIYRGKVADTPFAVVTFLGKTFMGNYESPFVYFDKIREEIGDNLKVIIVDFHAEATSEKVAFGRYLDGKVSAVLGTHTHVQTADEQILPEGTAYITDVGMTGPHDGVIGMATETVLPRFLTGLPTRFEPAEGDVKFHGVVMDIDDSSGKASSIERISVAQKEFDSFTRKQE
jgi:metallophosphoesterase (TIGR00282 family)